MIYLFSNNGTKFLESICFSRSLFAFDFDGTLSKIVRDPDAANIDKTTLLLIQRLGELAPVAIISGRGLNDLRRKFNPSPGFLVGNHGLEGIHAGDRKLEAFRESCETWLRYLSKKLLQNRDERDGIEIEDKVYSIAVHYRRSRAKKIAKAKILHALGGMTPSARIILGKCVVNVVPTGAPHKGMALLELMLKSKTRSAFYIGDDDTDEDIFTLPDPRLFTVRVGQKKTSQAKFYIQKQSEINRLLKTLIQNLERDKEA